MAIAPGTYNMTVQRRSDHSVPIVLKDNTGTAINLTGFTVAAQDSSGSAIDLTGYTVAAQVYDESRSTKYADWAVTYTDRSAGSFSIALTDTQTATFTPEILAYDVLLVDGSGLKEYYLEGKIFMSEGYTTT